MGRLKDLPNVDRPREKLIKYGPEKLSDAELLAVVLSSGTKKLNVLELSRKILRDFGSDLVRTDVASLQEIDGIGQVKASQIVSLFELSRRLLQKKQAVLLLSPRDVFEALKDIRAHKKEHFVVFFLDTKHQEIKREIISVGTLNANLVHPREVFEPAIQHLASHIIVAHNHPSGTIDPSPEDVAITQRLKDAGTLLGIELMDHIIVTDTEFVSFKEKELL